MLESLTKVCRHPDNLTNDTFAKGQVLRLPSSCPLTDSEVTAVPATTMHTCQQNGSWIPPYVDRCPSK